MKKKGIKELVFPLRKFDGERPDLDAPNGEVEVEAGLIGRVLGVSGDLPADGWKGTQSVSKISFAGRAFPTVRFGLERVSLSAGVDPDVMTGYSLTFQSDVENADSYVKGTVARPDETLYSKVRKGFASAAFVQLKNLRSLARERNLLSGTAWVVAAWRLASGDYCFVGPPVLLVADSYQPQLTIESATRNGKETYAEGKILQRFCRLLCRVDTGVSLPPSVESLDLFVLIAPEPGYDANGDGQFGTVRTVPVSVSGKAGEDGVSYESEPTDYGTLYSRMRSWVPDGTGVGVAVPPPEGLRLVSSVPRSRLGDFSSFAEPDYLSGGLHQGAGKNGMVLSPDYGYCCPVTGASVCLLGSRRLLFSIVRGVPKGFSSSEAGAYRTSESIGSEASRTLVGLRKGERETYASLSGIVFRHAGGEYPFGTSFFYPDPDAFEYVAEIGGVRYRFPLRKGGGGAFRTMFDAVIQESATIPLEAVAINFQAQNGELWLESEHVPNLYPQSLRSVIGGTGEVSYVGGVDGEPNVVYLFSETGVRLLRVNSGGRITEISRPSEDEAEGGVVATGTGYIFLTSSGVRVIESGKIRELADLTEFRLHVRPSENLLARLPLSAQLLDEHCDISFSDIPSRLTLSYHDESGLVRIVTDSGETFVGKITYPEWTYIGISGGCSGNGYLITRPVKIGGGSVRARVYGADMLFSGTTDPGDVFTVLYGSENLNDWVPLGIGKGQSVRVYGYSTARFYRVLYVGRTRPEGMLLHVRPTGVE